MIDDSIAGNKVGLRRLGWVAFLILGCLVGTVVPWEHIAREMVRHFGKELAILLLCLTLVIAPFVGAFLLAFQRLALFMDRIHGALGLQHPLEKLLDPMIPARARNPWKEDPRQILRWLIWFEQCMCFYGIGVLISGAWTNHWSAPYGAWVAVLNADVVLGAILMLRCGWGC